MWQGPEGLAESPARGTVPLTVVPTRSGELYRGYSTIKAPHLPIKAGTACGPVPEHTGTGPQRQAQASRAGMASLGATSLNWVPVGSVAAARRPYGVSSAGRTIEPPSSTIFARAASVSATPK